MAYEEWKDFKSVFSIGNQRIIQDFELNYPGLASMYEKRKAEELEKMRKAMNISDRKKRWEALSKVIPHDARWEAGRKREGL